MKKIEFSIEQIDCDEVHYYKKERFNSNNHWTDGQPEDYEEVLNKTQTKYWIDSFHSHYIVVNIDQIDVKWMKEATRISNITRKISRIHKDEIQEAIEKYEKRIGQFFNNSGKGFFVRSDTVSLKNSIHGVGPYTSVKMLIEGLITCKIGHTPVETYTKEVKLYLMEWRDDLEFHKEFRVFVKDKKITAISQQHLYTENEILKSLSEKEREETITKWCTLINDYYENSIKDKIKVSDSYVMDFALTKDDKPYFIEINCFGKEYASGSSLFHWILDEMKLDGHCRYDDDEMTDTIFVRYSI